MADDFDPDAYLKRSASTGDFDPDAYLNKPSVGVDVAKSAGVGVGKGLIGLAGLTGDVRELNAAAISKLAGLAGYDLPQGKASSVLRYVPGMMGPSSSQVQRGAESITGEFYKPQTTAGEYAQTVGEFTPAAAAGPGGVVRKAAQAIVPGLASEGLGQFTKGTVAEPVARVVGGVAGGVASAPKAATAALKPAQIEARAAAGYQHPEVDALIFKALPMENLANSIKTDLRRAKANEKLAGQTHALVDDLKNPVGGGLHRYEDLQTTRELLETQAKNFANPQEQRAATIALKSLTKYIDNIPQADLIAGNASLASPILTAARGDYASAKTAERVAEKIYAAELQAGSAHSGGNLQNALRQQQKQLLSKKGRRGLSETELAQVEEGVTGSLPANLLRASGKLLGAGGGLGMTVTTGGSYGLFGLPGLAAAPLGYGLKRAGDVLARRKADALVEAILQRAPSAQAQTRANIAAYDPRGRIAQLLALEASERQGQRP